jgi:hypothetical protein
LLAQRGAFACFDAAAVFDANTESCFAIFFDPQCGHSVPCQRVLATSRSKFFPHSLQ